MDGNVKYAKTNDMTSPKLFCKANLFPRYGVLTSASFLMSAEISFPVIEVYCVINDLCDRHFFQQEKGGRQTSINCGKGNC